MVIGKGAAGTVWKAINTQTGDFVAIKQIPLQNVESEQDLDSIQVCIGMRVCRNRKLLDGS